MYFEFIHSLGILKNLAAFQIAPNIAIYFNNRIFPNIAKLCDLLNLWKYRPILRSASQHWHIFKSYQIVSDHVKSCQILPILAKSWPILSNLSKFCKYCEILSNPAIYCKILPHPANYCQPRLILPSSPGIFHLRNRAKSCEMSPISLYILSTFSIFDMLTIALLCHF